MSGASRGEYHEHEHCIFFPESFPKHCSGTNVEYCESTDHPRHQEVLIMIYDAEVMEEIYDDSYVETSLDDDEIDAREAGFMHGYLGNWKGF